MGDIDAYECHGIGLLLHDAVEVSALLSKLREDEYADSLIIGTAKTCFGNAMECTGMTGLLKTIIGGRMNNHVAGQHLNELSPHISGVWDGDAGIIPTEDLAYKHNSSFCISSGRSLTGTIAQVLPWCSTEFQDLQPPKKHVIRNGLVFWPEGGGALEDEQLP